VIFVSIAAFCDPWLPFTVRDACAKAVHPERLVFAVFEQDVLPREVELRAITGRCGAGLRYRHAHPVQSQGVCWARAGIGEMYGGEPWLLQIDSHMLFEPRWDEQLLAQHAEVAQQSPKPIITCYPWAFEMENGAPTVAQPPSSTTTLVMRPVPEARLDPSSATMMFRTEHIAGRNPRPINYQLVPNCTYCEPEIGSVGLTEAKAREKGYEVKVGRFPFTALGKAIILGETEGFVKVVSDARYDEVLGVHIMGPHATDLLAEACVALGLEATTEELGHIMHAHPTLSEAVMEAAEAVHGMSTSI